MPFKLKLKKTRQYNVASKNLFVISVELLDGGVADCTLSVDSTGQECLDNVCQRQAINQPEFFGLRYINRTQQPRWVQLERPLKRQLDKYASSHQLFLRIMYYVVSGTSLITDEVTRYHYFLQLKNDLVEGRIICDCEQAVILASYSRQAEYGNHDRERHTVDYLKNVLTFPKQMIDGGQIIESSSLAESGKLEWLTSAVIRHRMTLHNMSQAQAEEGFISACQQLRGYGQEMFAAHDQLKNTEVTIAVSLNGIMVLSETSDTPHFYRWMDITNVINHKRTFSIECAAAGASASFALRTPELGKYVWRACVQQHTFYMKHQQASTDVRQPHHQTNFQEHGLSESREELDSPRDVTGSGALQPLTASHRAHSTSCLELQRPEPPRRVQLPQYRPAPDYETAIQQKYQQQRAEAHLRYQSHHHGQLGTKPLVYGSHPDIHRVHYPDVTRHTVSQTTPAPAEEYAYGLKFLPHNSYTPFALNPNVQTELNPQLHYVNVYKPPPPYPSNGLASNSTPDLAVASQAYHRGYINSHVSGSSPDLVSTRTALNRQYLGYINGNVNLMNYGRPVVASTHGTYNNLTSVLDPHIIMDPHHMPGNIQKVYDERGNIMYSMPMRRTAYQRHVVLPQQSLKLGEAHEPIYENVPLPWQSDSKVTMRDRAQSLTTTDEIARLNERNTSHPAINNYGQLHLSRPNLTVPNYPKDDTRYPRDDTHYPRDDSHYVNAQIIKGVRESSVPKDLNISNRSINKEQEFENITLSVDRLSLTKEEKDYDETPYTSLSTHRVSNNNTVYEKSNDNVTSITIPDLRVNISTVSQSDSVLTNSTISRDDASSELESSGNTTKSSTVSGKEKKRRRWGMFMGRAGKGEVKSATLGRDRSKPPAQPPNKHRWSTGLPKLQPLPPSISKETLCQLLERKMSDGQLSFAFEQIPKGRSGPPGALGAPGGAEVRTALLPAHAPLNGYSADSLPYEDNRVKLLPTVDNPHGYVNASHITMTVGSSQRFYVIAKIPPPSRPKLTVSPPSPSPSPAALLWETAWLVGARVVAHVGGPERPCYLPQEHNTVEYGKLSVSTCSESLAAWGGSALVRVRSGGRARDLCLVRCARWPGDVSAPSDVQLFLGFLSELNGLRLACAAEGEQHRLTLGGRNAPLLFACEQGAGRSGVALAADLLLHVLDNNQELDISRTIRLLHQQRANLIQNVHQYKFLHQLLLQYLKQSRLI